MDRVLSLNHRVQCICITHNCLNPCSKEPLIVSVFHKYRDDLFGPILFGLISQVFLTFSVIDDVIVFVLSADNCAGYFYRLFLSSFPYLVSVELND